MNEKMTGEERNEENRKSFFPMLYDVMKMFLPVFSSGVSSLNVHG